MYVVYIDNSIYRECESPVEAQLIAEAGRRLGYDVAVVFDEGSRCCV